MNLDPKIDYLPDWILNFICNSIMDENTKQTESIAESLKDNKSKHFGMTNGKRKTFYAYCQDLIQGGSELS
jgi:hypothetical protein